MLVALVAAVKQLAVLVLGVLVLLVRQWEERLAHWYLLPLTV